MLKFLNKFKLTSFSVNRQISIIELFKNRKLYYQSNSLELQKPQILSKIKGKSVYCGYDPTASSLHLGNLISILMLARLNVYGLKPIFLIGGATGLIGDPSGKNKQRQLIEVQTVRLNINSLNTQIKTVYTKILQNLQKNHQKYSLTQCQLKNLSNNPYQILNNYSFYESLNFIQFLRQVGKNFRLSSLLSKEMVVKRLQSQQGLSFAQFSYSLMQGYDFCHLFQSNQCVLQIGGSDQWGNILNGTQLIKKTLGKDAYAVTMPLLLTKSGAKFGKSEGNALFLNSEKTSINEIYQYFYNTADEDLQKYLSIFTFYSEQKIAQIVKEHFSTKQSRHGQQILAKQVSNLLGQYENKDKQFFTLTSSQLLQKDILYIETLFLHKKSTQPLNYIQIESQKLSCMKQPADLFVFVGFAKSKKQVRRQIQAGGLYINNQRINKNDTQTKINQQNNHQQQSISRKQQDSNSYQQQLRKGLLGGRFLILRWGKKKYHFVQII